MVVMRRGVRRRALREVTEAGRRSHYMRPVVVVDLDSTLCDTRHRHVLAPKVELGVERNWVAYSMACSDDIVIEGTRRTVKVLSVAHDIHLVSFRNNEARERTMDWLWKNDVPYHSLKLKMPGEFDNQHDDYKVDYVKRLQAQGHEVVLVIDDWPGLAPAMLRETGVPVMVVNPCYWDNPMAAFMGEGRRDKSEVSANDSSSGSM